MNHKVIIYYDHDCGFCKKSCLFFKKIFFLKNAQILPISSNDKAKNIFIKEYSWAVYDSSTDTYFSKSSALWRLVKASPFSFLFFLSKLPGVIFLGDAIYDVIAVSRPKTCTV